MRVQVNGTELYFDVEGAGLAISGGKLVPKPTIIILHGGPGNDHGYLRPGLAPLREHARLVFIDQRGQGRSGRPPVETCTPDQWANDVVGFCNLLGIEHPVVFGHSAGGFVALNLAIRYPDFLSALILCDTAATADTTNFDLGAEPNLASRAGPDAPSAARSIFRGDITPESLKRFGELVSPHYVAPSHRDVLAQIAGLSILSPEVMRYFWGTIAPHYDLRDGLGRIKARTLVIVGSHDWIHPPSASRTIAQAISGAKLIELEDSGHLGFSEQPERFQEIVIAFLQEASLQEGRHGV